MKDIQTLPDNYIDNIYQEIGKNVKKIRMEKGCSQLKLAQAIGHKSLSIVSLAEIYHNKQHFNIEHLVKIAYVLEVDICDFFHQVPMIDESQ
ncbi:MAG: helix-turn-helix transcriptional regulator [Thiovulaceae bacterium]|nr:helix-turn-helix transcriptional regulator [Sulfurimonadaceae bacterium]